MGLDSRSPCSCSGVPITNNGNWLAPRYDLATEKSEPAVASLGLTEALARESGYEVSVGTARFAGSWLAKALT